MEHLLCARPKGHRDEHSKKVVSFMRQIFSWERLRSIIDCVMVLSGSGKWIPLGNLVRASIDKRQHVSPDLKCKE